MFNYKTNKLNNIKEPIMEQDLFQSKYWMKIVLKAAALYNWVWGIWVILFPFLKTFKSAIQKKRFQSLSPS